MICGLGTSVLIPTMRYQPAIGPRPSPRWLGSWWRCPGRRRGDERDARHRRRRAPGRRHRLEEAIKVIRALSGPTSASTLAMPTRWSAPPSPAPGRADPRCFFAASEPTGREAHRSSGRRCSCTSGKSPDLYRRAGRTSRPVRWQLAAIPRQIVHGIEIKVSYDTDVAVAEELACHWWAALALSGEQKAGIEDPVEMARLADENADKASRFIVSNDPDEASSGSPRSSTSASPSWSSMLRATIRLAPRAVHPRCAAQASRAFRQLAWGRVMHPQDRPGALLTAHRCAGA